MAVEQQNVFIGMRFFLAAVVFGLPFCVFGALSPPFRAVNQQIGSRFLHQGAVGNCLWIALRCHAYFGQGLLQDRHKPMNPVIRSRLAETKLQSVHRLQRICLLVNQNKQKFVFNSTQPLF